MRSHWHVVVLATWYAAVVGVHLWRVGDSWHYFVQGGLLVLGRHPAGSGLPGGLHVYANYPQLQIGPLSLLVAVPLALLGGIAGETAAVVLLVVAGPLLLRAVSRELLSSPTPHRRLRLVLAGLPFLALWTEVAIFYAHLDDVLVLVLTVVTVLAVRRGHAVVAAVGLGLAVDAKPWAVVFLPLLLALPRRRLPALTVTVAIVLVAWLPFVMADPRTLTAAGYRIPTAAGSALHVLGVHDLGTPGWDRPVQLAVGSVLGLLAVRRRRSLAVVALGIAARIALDPAVYNYYASGLLTGTLLWDLGGTGAVVPWASLVATVTVYVPALVPGVLSPEQRGVLRLLGAGIVAVLVFAHRKRPVRHAR